MGILCLTGGIINIISITTIIRIIIITTIIITSIATIIVIVRSIVIVVPNPCLQKFKEEKDCYSILIPGPLLNKNSKCPVTLVTSFLIQSVHK